MSWILCCLLMLSYMFSSVDCEIWTYKTCSTANNCARNENCMSGKCQTCRGHADCQDLFPGTKPFCKSNRIDGNTCEQCVKNEHCLNAASPRCFNNQCTGCQTAADCTHIPGGKGICLGTGECVQCAQTSHCTGIFDLCSSGYCVSTSQGSTQPCGTWGCNNALTQNCGSDNYCRSCSAPMVSVGCTSQWHCNSDGSCQPCSGFQDCPNHSQSRCSKSSSSYTCAACSDHSNCEHVRNTVNTPYCWVQCVECLTNIDCNGAKCFSGYCGSLDPDVNAPLTITISPTSDPSKYTIDFSIAFTNIASFEQGIAMRLAGATSSSFSYTLSPVTTTQYEATFTALQAISITAVEVLYNYIPLGLQSTDLNTQWIQGYATTQTIPYNGPPPSTPGSPGSPGTPVANSPTVVSEAQSTMATAGVAAIGAAVGASGAIAVIGGNPAVLWALVSLIQTFYYLMFINVNYPDNVKFFLKLFTVASFDFIPNPMEWFNPDIEDQSLPTPERFEEYEVDGLFLNNAGNMLLVWVVVLVIYVVSFICHRYLNRLSKLSAIFFAKMILWFEWGGVLRAMTTSYPELIQAAFLQLRVLKYDTALYFASSVIAIAFSAFAVVFPFFTVIITKRMAISKGRMWKKCETLTEEFTPEGVYPKYFTSIFLFKRLVIIASLVFLHNYPYIEIFALISLSAVTIALLAKFKPYETKFDNYNNFAQEVIFLIVHLAILVLIQDDNSPDFSEDQRLIIGWVIIGLCGIVVILGLLAVIHEQINMIKVGWQLLKRVIRKKSKKQKQNTGKKNVRIKPLALRDTSLDASNMSASPTTSVSFHRSSVLESPAKMRIISMSLSPRLKRNSQLHSFDESL